MARSLADTIREITRTHLEAHNGLLFGQAITAVGWVNNTVPDSPGIVELPMSDVSNMGVACGAALGGRRPIIVIRFQDFMWLNSSMLVNYAAKAREIFGVSVPVFVRALAQENAGCTHSGVLHSLFMHVPGLRVASPMSPAEYEAVWTDYLAHDDPYYVSEHRGAFSNTEEFVNTDHPAEITLIGISAARFNLDAAAAILARDGIRCNQAHAVWLKPRDDTAAVRALSHSRVGLVVDAGFETCGAAQSLAYHLSWTTGRPVRALGIEDRCVGVSPASRNPTPTAERIAAAARAALAEKAGGASPEPRGPMDLTEPLTAGLGKGS